VFICSLQTLTSRYIYGVDAMPRGSVMGHGVRNIQHENAQRRLFSCYVWKSRKKKPLYIGPPVCLSVVCTECIVAKRCVLGSKSYREPIGSRI